MIKRYGFVDWEAFDEKDNGLYVLYTDHIAALTEKDKEIERLKDTINGLINFIPDGWEMPLFWNQLVMQVKEDSDE